MKAAIVQQFGHSPVYGNIAEPVVKEGECLIRVRAAALTQLAKAQVSGRHYSIRPETHALPFVPGTDGVGVLADGRRVYFAYGRFPYGSMAELSLTDGARVAPLPDDIDDNLAAAIANAGMSSWAALTRRAHIVPGETVWIMGATGNSGGLAVSIARHLGAGRIIAVGRNAGKAPALLAQGADRFIQIVDERSLEEQLSEEASRHQPHIILDYLWGEPAERVLAVLQKAKPMDKCIWVQIGSSAGDPARIPAQAIRSSALQMLGSGLGSVSYPELVAATGEMLAAAGRAGLTLPYREVSLAEVGAIWTEASDARIVFRP